MIREKRCTPMLTVLLVFCAAALWEGQLAAKTTVLLVHDPGQRGAAEEAQAALQALLPDLSVELRLQPSDLTGLSEPGLDPLLVERLRRDGTSLVVRFEPPPRGTMVLTFIGDRRVRVVERELPAAESGALGRYEAMALMIRSGLEAIAQKEDLIPRVKRGARDNRAVLLSGGYQLRSVAPAAAWSHAAWLSTGISFAAHWQVSLEYAYRGESLIHQEALDLHLKPQSIKLRCAFEPASGAIFWGVALGVQLDLWKWRVTTSNPDIRSAGATIESSLSGDLAVRFGVDLSPRFALLTEAGLEVPIDKQGFRLESGDRSQLIWNLSGLRPYLGVSLRFRLALAGE